MASILLIEDTRDTRTVVELILQDAGHSVISAADGASGLAVAAAKTPDLILMDLALPRVDGWEATRRLKANPATRDIPVVAFTAHVLQEDADRAREAGCEAIIVKPFDIATLLNQIDALVERQRSV
ncbi:MAG TPA: response regulator [Roseiflexaceae bacterium]|nr:response regulator [Roseiflexaceae bacterium]